MGILLLVTALFVVAILLSHLTWSSKRGERRSVEGHEQAMDVLRSLPNRRIGAPAAAGIEAEDHARSSIGDAVASPAAAIDGGSAPAAAEGATKPSFVFLADEVATPPAQGGLGSPPSIDEVLARSASRPRAVLSAFSRSIGEPRVGIAVGVGTIVVIATVATILTGIMSSSPSRSQQVRQVTSPPITDQAPPAPPPTIPSPAPSEATPTTSAPVAAPVATIISPATTTPRSFSSTTISTIQPPRSTIPRPVVATSPPTTAAPPPTTATSVSPPTTSTTRPTTTTTSPTSTTSTTSKP
jgi:hypothetical protein